jgi:hypothetical protein
MEGDEKKCLREKKSVREDKTWYRVKHLAMNENWVSCASPRSIRN